MNDELDILTHEHRLEFNNLTPRSIRIMNRFARAANRFLEVNRFKIDPMNQDPISWVVQTIFKSITSYLTRASYSAASFANRQSSVSIVTVAGLEVKLKQLQIIKGDLPVDLK